MMSTTHSAALERMNRFESAEGKATAALIRPKDAATLILVDRSGSVPKVLLGKRHARHKFMPGMFVFPGGGVDPSDAKMTVARPLHADVEAQLMKRLARPTRAKAQALALAAIRETFEETGLVIGVRAHAINDVPAGAWAGFAQAGILPDLAPLHFIGRAITPPRRPRRFDARFFAMDARAIAYRLDGVTGPEAELVELVWMPLADAQHLRLPAVTSVMLEELDARIALGFDRKLPVPFYRMPRKQFMREML